MNSKMILNMALEEINHRRNLSNAENNMHFEEISKKIPEIGEINSQLARTGMELIEVIKSGDNVSEKIEDLKRKNVQAQEIVKKLLTANGYPEDYLKVKYRCSKCFDTGFVNHDRCECLKKLIANITAKEMNKNSQIKLCNFESFRLDYYQGNSPETTAKYRDIMQKIYGYCKRYSDTFSLESDNILMFGRTGLGKTHLSLSIANEVLQKGYNVLYDSSLNYLHQIEKEYFGKASGDNDTLGALISSDLLILDDFGTEFDKSFYISTIYNIINTRLNKGLPTIISTNLNYEEMLERYGERICSRLFTVYTSLEFVGTDIRLIKRKMGI